MKENIEKIRKGVENANDFDITVTIKGKFLVDNNLCEVWANLRGINSSLIDEDYSDTISLYQAEILGIIKKM